MEAAALAPPRQPTALMRRPSETWWPINVVHAECENGRAANHPSPAKPQITETERGPIPGVRLAAQLGVPQATARTGVDSDRAGTVGLPTVVKSNCRRKCRKVVWCLLDQMAPAPVMRKRKVANHLLKLLY